MKPLTWTEPRLDDLLSDPLVVLVMRSDSVLPEVLRTQMYAVRSYLRQKRYGRFCRMRRRNIL